MPLLALQNFYHSWVGFVVRDRGADNVGRQMMSLGTSCPSILAEFRRLGFLTGRLLYLSRRDGRWQPNAIMAFVARA
ncbi:hypothetical protein NL676_035060 [Syzygium grande]|nr:hypothetical protein NL676_035060 [Syzygium grande]